MVYRDEKYIFLDCEAKKAGSWIGVWDSKTRFFSIAINPNTLRIKIGDYIVVAGEKWVEKWKQISALNTIYLDDEVYRFIIEVLQVTCTSHFNLLEPLLQGAYDQGEMAGSENAQHKMRKALGL